MQEKRNKRLLISLLAMIIAIVAFWFFAFRESKIEVDENALMVPVRALSEAILGTETA